MELFNSYLKRKTDEISTAKQQRIVSVIMGINILLFMFTFSPPFLHFFSLLQLEIFLK